MRYSIERVDWKDWEDVAGAILLESFPGTPVEHYAWLHNSNPAGRAALWLARAADGRAVGTVAVHPRHVLVGGRRYTAGVTSNFAVDRTARPFGPAVALQRAAVAACDAGEFDFLYGFANPLATPVFERVGYRAGAARRLARPLRTRPYLERDTRLASVAPVLAPPLDLALRLLSRETYRGVLPGSRLERVEAFDETSDAFWSRVRAQPAVVGDRDTEYMNWRYAECPTRRYELAVLRRGRDVTATIVWYRQGAIVYVAEALAADSRSLDDLLSAFLRAQRGSDAFAVSVTLLGGADVATMLAERYGFVPRQVERTLHVYVPPWSELAGGLPPLERWDLYLGDVL
jgi:hypothetical protein